MISKMFYPVNYLLIESQKNYQKLMTD